MSRLKGVLANPLLTVVRPVFSELAPVEEVVRIRTGERGADAI